MGDPRSRLLELLPQDGSPRSNAELRQQLDLSEAEYWRIRNQLLDEGLVSKSRGRGGRTALVTEVVEAVESRSSKVSALLFKGAVGLGGLAAVLLLASFFYVWVSWGRERAFWDVLSLFFGAVTVAAVGASLLIYRAQLDAAEFESDGQARILKRLVALAGQAAVSSVDARDILQVMRPAVSALTADGEEVEPSGPAGDDDPAPGVEPGQHPEGATFVAEHGVYYLPSEIPLWLIGELVKWWESSDEKGRWKLSQLVGGYRKFNRSGTLAGMPWILTFDSGDGKARSFQIRYTGRQKGALVEELTEDGVWQEFEK